jgi:hypothetical protein
MAEKVIEVEYNSQKLGMIRTNTFHTEPLMDSSGIDQIGYSTTFECTFILAISENVTNGSYGPVVMNDDKNRDNANSPTGVIQRAYIRLRKLLTAPRKGLKITQDGVTVINTVDQRDAIVQPPLDDFNGPLPGTLDIVTPLGLHALLLKWSVNVKFAMTADRFQTGQGPVPLSIKYEQEHDISTKGDSTILTRGEIKSQAPVFNQEDPKLTLQTIDTLRKYSVPKLLPGYSRKSNFRMSKDGTTLSFSFTDIEKHLQPPEPAFEGDGHFGISGSGALWHGDLSITLKGGKRSDKQKLLELAMAMALSRVKSSSNAGATPGSQMWSAMFAKAHGGVGIREKLFENTVTVNMRYLLTPSQVVKSTSDYQILLDAANSALLNVPGGIGLVYGLGTGLGQAGLGVKDIVTGKGWGAGGRRVGSGLKQAVRGVFGAVPNPIGIGWSIWQFSEDAKAATQRTIDEAKKIAAQQQQGGPVVLVPENAMKSIGIPLEGCQPYRSVDPGIRGNPVPGPVLLIAGFLRDPSVPLAQAINELGSGVRGPIALNGNQDIDLPDQPNGKNDQAKAQAVNAVGLPGAVALLTGVNPPASLSPIGSATAVGEALYEIAGRVSKIATIDPVDNSWSGGGPNSDSDSSFSFSVGETIYGEDDLPVPEDAYSDGLYTDYFSEVSYKPRPTHIVMYPTGGDGIGKSIKVYSQNPMMIEVKYYAVKSGSAPVVPFKSVSSTDGNCVYAGGDLTFPSIDVGSDGTITYTAKVHAIYNVLDPSKIALRPMVPPFLDVEMNDLIAALPDPDWLKFGITEEDE